MDLTELVALGSGLSGAFGGFVLGLRFCGPRLQTTWTERHPYEIAQDVIADRQKMRALHPHTQRLVARELQALNTNRPQLAEVPLVLDGISHRYRHLSDDALALLAEERAPAARRSTPAGPGLRLIPHTTDPADVFDAEWTEAEPSWPRAA
jgi:hypothetical protein